MASSSKGQRRRAGLGRGTLRGIRPARGSRARLAAASRRVAACRGEIGPDNRAALESRAPRLPHTSAPRASSTPPIGSRATWPGLDGSPSRAPEPSPDGAWAAPRATSTTARLIRAMPPTWAGPGHSRSSTAPARVVKAGPPASMVRARRVPSRRRAAKKRLSPRAIPTTPLQASSNRPWGGSCQAWLKAKGS